MWLYEGKEFEMVPSKVVGFVYKISNTLDGREYIGKKLFNFSTKKPPKKGNVRKRRVTKESDWREYFGSSEELMLDVEKLGREHFTREILLLCETKGQCNYHEARLQFEYRVLENPDKFYNRQIRCRVHQSHLKLQS